MNKLMIAAIAAAASLAAPAMAQGLSGYRAAMERAAAAFQAEDWAALDAALSNAQISAPGSLYVYRNRILAKMLNGEPEEALALVEKAADQGLTLNLAGHPAFDDLKALPAYEAIAAKMEANSAALGAPSSIREFGDTDLLPEAIAYDRKGALYIGSVRSGAILRAGKKDDELTLISHASGGVFDIEIRGDRLWAAVNNQLAYEKAGAEDAFASVMAFNAKSGAPVREVRVAEPDAMLGDLEVAKDGTVYASDSITPRIFRMAPDGETLDVFSGDPRFANPQGIALDEKAGKLYMADYLAGLFVIDTATGDVTQLRNDADAWIGGIDGLYLYGAGLIGIQNGSTPQRIVYMGLNDDRTAITSFITMHRSLNGWNEPTHGAVAGKEFRYIATSNWPSYGDNGAVKDEPALQPLRIMTLPLESK
ncbi:hypothetical protein [Hyphococcus sp.]|uniref:Vgb family protein n=1 Tax=Hyphococcus sp. TaxID=2038636 RepID=UPI003D124C0C